MTMPERRIDKDIMIYTINMVQCHMINLSLVMEHGSDEQKLAGIKLMEELCVYIEEVLRGV